MGKYNNSYICQDHSVWKNETVVYITNTQYGKTKIGFYPKNTQYEYLHLSCLNRPSAYVFQIP